MEYLILIMVIVAVAAYYRYKQRNNNERDVSRVEATYACDQCNENDCDCHKKEA